MITMTAQNTWTTIITPKAKLLDFDLKELWRYRDLLTMFVKRDVVTMYKQTILGPLWFFINPIFTTIIYVVIFGNIAKLSPGGVPQILFFLSGVVTWNYFSETLTRNASTFTTNASIFGKVYFPRLIVPLSIVLSNLLKLAIQFGLFIAAYVFFLIKGDVAAPNAYALLFPLLICLLAGLGLGFGIIFSSMTTKYRDLTFLLTFGVSLWQYATPIIYPLSKIPEKYRIFVQINPVTPIVETFKYGFLGVGEFSWWALSYSTVFTVILLFAGILVFNKVQRSFMDTV